MDKILSSIFYPVVNYYGSSPTFFWLIPRPLLQWGYFSPHCWEQTGRCLQRRWGSVTAVVPVRSWLASCRLAECPEFLALPSWHHAHCVRQLLYALCCRIWKVQFCLKPANSELSSLHGRRQCGWLVAMLSLPQSSLSLSAFPWPGSAMCAVAGGASWVSVWPSYLGLQLAGWVCLRGTQPPSSTAFLHASLQLGAPSCCGAQAAACIRIGGWFLKYCGFIFIQCSQGIGSITQKNNLIINLCLHSKSGLSVPAWQPLLAAALLFEVVWIDMGWSCVWLLLAMWYQPVF